MAGDTHPKRGRKKQGRHPERVLAAAFVRTVTQPGRYLDGLGLSLLVTPTGGRCWIQRLTVAGRVRELGLGGYPVVTLAQAREKALANKRLARQGGDPLAEKRKRAAPTFAEAAAQVLALHPSRLAQRQTRRPMGNYPASIRLPAAGRPARAYHHRCGCTGRPGADLAHESRDGQAGPATDRGSDEVGGRAGIPG